MAPTGGGGCGGCTPRSHSLSGEWRTIPSEFPAVRGTPGSVDETSIADTVPVTRAALQARSLTCSPYPRNLRIATILSLLRSAQPVGAVS